MATEQQQEEEYNRQIKGVVHHITMTDDHTLRLITNLATKDYTVNDLDELEKQLDNHKYEENKLVLEPNYNNFLAPFATIFRYFIRKGYSEDYDIILRKNRSVK